MAVNTSSRVSVAGARRGVGWIVMMVSRTGSRQDRVVSRYTIAPVQDPFKTVGTLQDSSQFALRDDLIRGQVDLFARIHAGSRLQDESTTLVGGKMADRMQIDASRT